MVQNELNCKIRVDDIIENSNNVLGLKIVSEMDKAIS